MLKWLCAGLTALVLLASIACGQSDEDKTEARRQGQHCLNLGNTNESFYAKVYSNLVDPGSLKEELTVIGPVIDGEHRIKMDFTTRNALGQTVRSAAIGWVDHETCEATLDSIE